MPLVLTCAISGKPIKNHDNIRFIHGVYVDIENLKIWLRVNHIPFSDIPTFNDFFIKSLLAYSNQSNLILTDLQSIDKVYECPIIRSFPLNEIIYCQRDGRLYDKVEFTKSIKISRKSPMTAESFTNDDLLTHPLFSDLQKTILSVLNSDNKEINLKECYKEMLPILKSKKTNFGYISSLPTKRQLFFLDPNYACAAFVFYAFHTSFNPIYLYFPDNNIYLRIASYSFSHYETPIFLYQLFSKFEREYRRPNNYIQYFKQSLLVSGLIALLYVGTERNYLKGENILFHTSSYPNEYRNISKGLSIMFAAIYEIPTVLLNASAFNFIGYGQPQFRQQLTRAFQYLKQNFHDCLPPHYSKLAMLKMLSILFSAYQLYRSLNFEIFILSEKMKYADFAVFLILTLKMPIHLLSSSFPIYLTEKIGSNNFISQFRQVNRSDLPSLSLDLTINVLIKLFFALVIIYPFLFGNSHQGIFTISSIFIGLLAQTQIPKILSQNKFIEEFDNDQVKKTKTYLNSKNNFLFWQQEPDDNQNLHLKSEPEVEKKSQMIMRYHANVK